MIDRAAPLVKALNAFDADEGHPPATLAALVPKYLAAIPTTGLEQYPEFGYNVGPEDPHHWRLSAKMESLGFRHMRYDPSHQYEIPVRELRDGWVMVDP